MVKHIAAKPNFWSNNQLFVYCEKITYFPICQLFVLCICTVKSAVYLLFDTNFIKLNLCTKNWNLLQCVELRSGFYCMNGDSFACSSMFRSSCVQESSSLTFEPQISNFLPPWKLTYAPAHSPRKYPFGIRAKSGSSEIFSLVLSSTCQGDWIRGVRFSSLENGDWTNLSFHFRVAKLEITVTPEYDFEWSECSIF